MDSFEFEEKDVDEFIEEEKQEDVATEDDEESVQEDNVMVLSDVDSEDDVEEVTFPPIVESDIAEIKFDPKKHIQHLTLNETTRIVMNVDDMINNNVLQIPKLVKRADFIYDIIVNNKLDIVIRRPIDLTSVVVVQLGELKINKVKLYEKLNKMFST